MAKTPQPQPESFESALAELEQIVQKMEGGEVPLDQSLQLYERGTYLIRHCQKRLDAAESRIEQLSRGEGDRLEAGPAPDQPQGR